MTLTSSRFCKSLFTVMVCLLVFFAAVFEGRVARRAQAESKSQLATLAETSGWKKTGRFEEVERLCPAFASAYPTQVRCEVFAKTPEGRPMLALIASGRGVFDPKTAKSLNQPVVFAQGGIHAGEIDGKDAGFLLLREILEGSVLPGVLDSITFVFLPVFNIDGHERFGAYNRPNQNGPEEMGWRTTAQNLNLNRDYVKAEAPEMAALLKYLGAWDPILALDLHVTDGAEFQSEVAVIVDPSLKGPDLLRRSGASLRDHVLADLKASKHLAVSFYPSFIRDDEPDSGFEVGVSPPRFSQGYWASRNRIGVLVETHSWKDYATRVKVTHDTLVSFLGVAAKDGNQWLKAAADADQKAKDIGGSKVELVYQAGKTSTLIDFPGYRYRRELSEISGQMMTLYDSSTPQNWRVPLFTDLNARLTVLAPEAGYLIPLAYRSRVEEKLRIHGVQFEVVKKPLTSIRVGTFRAEIASFGKGSFEGRTPLEVKGNWKNETRNLPAGSLFVPMDQPLSRLVLHLLEPQAPDSLLSWGFFNAAFEAKEYMEPYVAEKVARDMLAKNPKLKLEFENKLKTDPAFAKNPGERLNFFYRRHPSWDERLNLYPVYRTSTRP